jgi:hypothetical protein
MIGKADAPCSGATGIRRAGEKVALYLLDGLAYDPEPLGAGARQLSKFKFSNFLYLDKKMEEACCFSHFTIIAEQSLKD